MHLCVLVNFILYKGGFEKVEWTLLTVVLRLFNDSALQVGSNIFQSIIVNTLFII